VAAPPDEVAEPVVDVGPPEPPGSVDPVRVAAEPAERIIASAADPASEVIAAEVAKAVGRWLRDDLPEDLAARLTSWWHRTGAIAPPPPNLALAIDGYIFRLASAIALARD